MTNIRKISWTLILFAFLSPASVCADDPIIKLSRGLTNIVASPGEYLLQYKIMRGENNPLTALFATGVSGTLHMAGRVFAGAYDTVTFLVPLPPDYEPLYKPATFFEAFKEIEGNPYP